jgi:hypothetical protein
MNFKQRRRYEMLERVHAFGATHGEDLPAGTLAHHLFAVVGNCLRDAERHAMGQFSGRGQGRGATASKTAARNALWHSLDAIRRTARALALDKRGFDRRFRMPRGNGGQCLLNAGRVFALAARESPAPFVAYGLPPTFLDDLAARINDFERTIAGRRQSRVDRIAAGVGLRASLESAFLAVRRLDAVVPNLLGDDPAAMARWRAARHVVRTVRPRNTIVRHDGSKDQLQAELHLAGGAGAEDAAEVEHLPPQLEPHLEASTPEARGERPGDVPDESVPVIEARDRAPGSHVPHLLRKIRFVRGRARIRRIVNRPGERVARGEREPAHRPPGANGSRSRFGGRHQLALE